jgi:oxygen-independent coproporphyrinogen-3 oxidase
VWPTPLLSALFEALGNFRIAKNAEITIEANPGTLTAEKLRLLRAGGVNRLSLGLQAWQGELLRRIGRGAGGVSARTPSPRTAGRGAGDAEGFIEAFNSAREAGFGNISADIMFALPCQTPEEWEETLRQLTRLHPEHISAYALTVEEGTPLSKRGTRTDEGLDREMYHMAKAFLRERGYIQYELSNFSKPGFKSRHNTHCWTRAPYAGAGLGAHSLVYNEGAPYGARYRNTENLEAYIAARGEPERIRTEYTILSRADATAEFMVLGLRLTRGVSAAAFKERFGAAPRDIYGEWIDKMVGEGLLRERGGFLRLTDLGMDFANRVMAGFV